MARIYDMTEQGTAPGRTTVTVQRLKERVSGEDTVVSLGSCFSTEIGERMSGDGYRILNNPFGVLYNPVSIADSLRRLADAAPFTVHDVIPQDTGPLPRKAADSYHSIITAHLPAALLRHSWNMPTHACTKPRQNFPMQDG